jgi:putative SOS response-associated peptidase YedK
MGDKMCGRYAFFTDRELQEIDEIIEQISDDIQRDKLKTGEIFPTNVVPVFIPQKEIIKPKLMVWGFPNFQNKGVIINARAETVKEKKLFGSSLRERRCIIPSTGFYEWDAEKKKFIFNMPDSQLLYMAGIYNQFEGENRFVILTTEANSSMASVHNRMPVVVPKARIEDWILDKELVEDILFGEHPGLQMGVA